jgi:hypothetical protein
MTIIIISCRASILPLLFLIKISTGSSYAAQHHQRAAPEGQVDQMTPIRRRIECRASFQYERPVVVTVDVSASAQFLSEMAKGLQLIVAQLRLSHL